MTQSILLIVLATLISAGASHADLSMPPKNPKAQATKPPAPNPAGEYGEVRFSAKDAQPMATSATDGKAIIKTKVAEVCPKKGCWMNVQGAKPGEVVRVTFKDYGFFVPTELVGKEVALDGHYVKHVESVEEQKHLLQDAKRPQAEIDAVTKPRETLRFVATGVKDLSSKPK